MIALVQRVSSASVTVSGEVTGQIGTGLLVLLGVHHDDTEREAVWLADKLVALRVFQDDEGKMNRSVQDVGGEVLVVSQFTLYGDVRKGTRPSYIQAARPETAEPLYERMVALLAERLGRSVPTGRFGAMMDVALVNDGPVTLWIEREPGGKGGT
jgi:D-aminoacyl-tRNA deacylase